MSAILEVSNLSKSFGGLTALKNVSFSVRRGEIVGVLGPNGAGKTTLFNLLTGFIAPDQGRVIFDGKPLGKMAPHRIVNLGLARTFQLCRPFVGMTALENVMVACFSPRGARGAHSPDARSRALLDDVGLSRKVDVRSELLSYGDQRRLEIARALATDPQLLLLDEPFAGLGSSEIEPLSTLIRKLHREHGLTILIIEHKLREFMQLVQSVIAIDFGQVIASGTPEEIVRHPKVVDAYIGKTEVEFGAA